MKTQPVWTSRNLVIKNFIENNKTVVDFGCGNKDILNYISPKEYVGLDNNDYADIIIDFNKENITLPKKYDYGLILGVLEYLDSPYKFIKETKSYADTMLILIFPKETKKQEWNQTLSAQKTLEFLQSIYANVLEYRFGPYVLFKCS